MFKWVQNVCVPDAALSLATPPGTGTRSFGRKPPCPPTFSETGTTATCPSASNTSPYFGACVLNSQRPQGGLDSSLDWAMAFD